MKNACRLKKELEEIQPYQGQDENDENVDHWNPSQSNMIKITLMEFFLLSIRKLD